MKSIFMALLICVVAPSFSFSKAVTYKVGDTEYEGYYQESAPGAPLLIMVHDWDGLTNYEVKRAEMLADKGYNVFGVDLFGKGVRPTETSEKKRLTGDLYGDRELMRKLVEAGLTQAIELSGNQGKTAFFGYCFGGAVVLEMARSGLKSDGFVSFHGGLQTPDGQDYNNTSGKIMVFHGTADAAVSMQEFADLAVQLEEASIPHEMITYSGAPHAFTVFGSSRYHEEADTQSWIRFSAFLEETFR
jgi:dienelactone hydrolase